MKSKSRASLVLLCALIITFITDSSACDFTVEVGKSVTIKLGVDQSDELTWNRDSQREFKGKVSTVSTKLGNVEVTSDGSLKIKSAKMKDNGKHDFEVFLPNGKSKTKQSIILCVHEKPPKPTVNITCVDGKPSISCDVKDQTRLTGRTFSWFRNEKKMAENSASLRNTDEDGEYECAVEKPIPSEKSDKVSLSKTQCTKKPPKPTVNITCVDGKPSISCEVKDQTGLTGRTFSWFRDEKQIEKENSSSLRNTEEDGEYECAVEKPIPSEKSDKVRLNTTDCTGSGSDVPKDPVLLWGFERWIMISILAGGGGLVLLLMMVLVICACQSCKRREKRLQNQEKFVLKYQKDTSPHSANIE